MGSEEIPSLADMPLGASQEQTLRILRLLIVLFFLVGVVSMFLPDHIETCPNCDGLCSNPLPTRYEHNAFAHTSQIIWSFAALFVLLGVSLTTLKVKPQLVATVGWTSLLATPAAFLLASGSPIILRFNIYWSDRLPGYTLMGLSVAGLYTASVLGPIIRVLVNRSARKELLARIELPRATIDPGSE